MEVSAYKNNLSIKNKGVRLIWNIIYYLLFRPLVGPLFYKWRVFLLRAFGAKIGRHCKVRSSVQIWAPWNVVLGDYVALGPNCNIYSVDKNMPQFIATKIDEESQKFISLNNQSASSVYQNTLNIFHLIKLQPS